MSDGTPGDGFERLWNNPVSRRRLLGVSGYGAAAVTVGRSILPRGTGKSTAAAERSTLSAALTSTFPDLDPSVIPFPGSLIVADLWSERLYRVDTVSPGSDVTPELASDMPRRVSPTNYRVGLRTGVTFHDGSPFTADDVVFSLQRVKDPETGSFYAQFFEVIDDVRASDDHEVELTLTSPTTLLTQRLALIPIYPDSVPPETQLLEPVGSGPYRVVSAVTEQEVKLERFAEYSGERKLTFDEIDISVVADSNARVSGLRSGRFDVIEDVPASAFAQLTDTDGIEAGAVNSDTVSIMYFHAGKPPFDDARMRHAVLYAIDRDTITETSYFGRAQPAWAGHISPAHPEFVEPRTVHRLDPDHARQLIVEAGYSEEPIPIDILVPSDLEFLVSQAPIIEQNLAHVGFAPNIVTGERTGHFSRAAEGAFDIFLDFSANSIIFPSVETILRVDFYDVIPREIAHWSGDDLDEIERLLDEAVAAPDDDTRAERLAEAQSAIQDQVPVGALHHKQQLTAWSDALIGFRPSPTNGFVLDGVSA